MRETLCALRDSESTEEHDFYTEITRSGNQVLPDTITDDDEPDEIIQFTQSDAVEMDLSESAVLLRVLRRPVGATKLDPD